MDQSRFDDLTKVVTGLRTRRETLRAIAGGAAAALGIAVHDLAAAKKGKGKKKCKPPNKKCGKQGCCKPSQVCVAGKCKPGCKFTKTATIWTLQGNCSITRSIEIPDGVTIDGNNHTISVEGDYANFAGPNPDLGAAFALRNADGGDTIAVQNLTLDGARLSGRCNEAPSGVNGILLGTTSGSISDVRIRNFACGRAIYAVAPSSGPTNTVTITDTSIANVDPSGAREIVGALSFAGELEVTITGGSIRDLPSFDYGIEVFGSSGTPMVVDGMTFTNIPNTAIFANGGELTVRNSTFSNVGNGIIVNGDGGAFEATNNALDGPGSSSAINVGGIVLGNITSGSITGNTIADFFDSDPNSPSCGIYLDASVGPVTVTGNTFPSPGNEQDICDNRT